ncbi:MAG: hypothetical protein CMO74_07105 [Verrucomicrobiales bacterium]|nr:hypothetical protein [Verrucomicrobiales bacterium]|tara:strand:+ start:305 stop:685 length:381 start_codon:yes stop_codon:yes gene_type:complete
MKIVTAILAIIVSAALTEAAPKSLTKFINKQNRQRKALEEKHKAENLDLIEQQLADLEKLAKQLSPRDAILPQAEIDRLLRSTDAGKRFTAELFVDAINPKNPSEIKAMLSLPERLITSKKDTGGR